MGKSQKVNDVIYDARSLGTPKMLILGIQHMFAMFGATVLVPALTGLDVATTLLFAGLGTLLFHFITGRKVPAFLGSSFAFIGGYAAIAPNGDPALLPYACFGVAIAGLMYVILAALFKSFGVKKVMRFFPPIVTGPIIIAIGLTLSSSAIANCESNWFIAVVAIAVVIGFNMWGKGMAKIVPILLGVLVSYLLAVIIDPAARANVASAVSQAKWFGLPIYWNRTVFSLFNGNLDTNLLWTAALTIVPLSLATMVEHIGDICAISSTCERNYMQDPGFNRTLLGDGIGSMCGAFFGGCPNTTYGESIACVAITRNASTISIWGAAFLCIIVSFITPLMAFLETIPSCVMGGVCVALYGFIAVSGFKMIQNVDLNQNRNLFVSSIIFITGVGGMTVSFGAVELRTVACALILGILANVMLSKEKVEGTKE